MTFERYTAKVNGVAWAGYKGSTEYEFNHLPTRAEVLAKSGDFQAVTRISVTRTTTTIERVRVK